MDASWTNALIGALSLLTVLLGALIAKFFSVTKELSDFKTHVAENYATKDEVKDAIERVERQIEIGFNRLYEILNKRKTS
ncbi:hypothetical protein ACTFQF_15985 [Aliivibrio fischeri]|uniref:hypothetical protein n=1 Tax=Aliivibrio fischeri TaxID=668 RepID=UPI0007C4A574|nr:hypothetical protein [Aliivibrio fischeri]MBP3140136.1 hypothetical protein [Aliivibrio fischeri]MBP3154518.1 hypothetical protein [Aliivibrio fischeri]MCE7572260.1 hypothetical protein [Aliivibrio fischeri]